MGRINNQFARLSPAEHLIVFSNSDLSLREENAHFPDQKLLIFCSFRKKVTPSVSSDANFGGLPVNASACYNWCGGLPENYKLS
jgi:hypothetical protein